MRTLHLIALAEFGGVETYSRDLFAELERQGHEVVVGFDGPPVIDLEAAGRTVVRLPGLAGGAPGAGDHMAGLLDLIARHPPDVVQTHLTVDRAVAETLVSRFPIVASAHNYVGLCPSAGFFYRHTNSICQLSGAPNWRCLPNAFLHGCNTRRPAALLGSYRKTVEARAYLERFDAIVCDSDYVRERYVEQGFSRDKLSVLPSPVHIPDSPAAAGQVRREDDLLLFAGRVTPQKGLHLLLQAAATLVNPFRLVVAGSGYDLPRCQALARNLGLLDRVSFLGSLDRHQLQRLYRAATLLVVPSAWPEPLGMVGPEAMAFGLPVVGFDAGGISEWLVDGESGLLAKPADASDLREKIDHLLSEPLERMRLGENGRRLVGERFTVASHVESLVGLFQTICSRRTDGRAAAR